MRCNTQHVLSVAPGACNSSVAYCPRESNGAADSLARKGAALVDEVIEWSGFGGWWSSSLMGLVEVWCSPSLGSGFGDSGWVMGGSLGSTENATELKKDLTVAYNRGCQAKITNEVLEIVAGAEALRDLD
ncbi:hypothetical protein LWI29_024281 [Acer saccharum]|uniref:Uncharacterized protein n=1 Tax=Acer saccharum TaxID=4024 RepID=A0AA39VY46_ACESA|nr:hypothetical protein LWI29_024281 [Acer saccharum]